MSNSMFDGALKVLSCENLDTPVRSWDDLRAKYTMRVKVSNLRTKVFREPWNDRNDGTGLQYLTGKIESFKVNSDWSIITEAVMLCNDNRVHPFILRDANDSDGYEYYIIPADMTAAEETQLMREIQEYLNSGSKDGDWFILDQLNL